MALLVQCSPDTEKARTGPQKAKAPATGRWSAQPGASALTEEQLAEIRRLHSLGYLAGSQAAPLQSGVTIHDPDKSFHGLNLYTSGHAPEALAQHTMGHPPVFPIQLAARRRVKPPKRGLVRFGFEADIVVLRSTERSDAVV